MTSPSLHEVIRDHFGGDIRAGESASDAAARILLEFAEGPRINTLCETEIKSDGGSAELVIRLSGPGMAVWLDEVARRFGPPQGFVTLADEELCEWCGHPVLDGLTHGEDECFCGRCGDPVEHCTCDGGTYARAVAEDLNDESQS